MKALVFEEPRRAVVRELDIPTIAADEVLVRSRNVGVGAVTATLRAAITRTGSADRGIRRPRPRGDSRERSIHSRR